MKALDTNVLARFFLNDPDDAEALRQRPAAEAALSQPAFVPVTVVLEFEWVMRGFYGLPRGEVTRVLLALAGIDHVTIEDRRVVLDALDAYGKGLDFADALHLARSARTSAFMTFDQRLARRSKALILGPPVELLAG